MDITTFNICTECLDVDEAFGNYYAGNANALFDMIDRYAVQIEFPTATDIAAQRKAATISDERACFFDSATED